MKKFFAWLQSRQIVINAEHTFWQAFVVVFFAGLTNLLSVFVHGGLDAAQSALLALIISAVAAGLSAVKTALTSQKEV